MTIQDVINEVQNGRAMTAEDFLVSSFSMGRISARRVIHKIQIGVTVSGAAENRPIYPDENEMFFDETLGHTVFYTNGKWRNAAGVEV